MKCFECKQYEESGMITGDAWNHFDENGEDNGEYEREMQAYQESQDMFDMNGDPIRDFEGNPW